MYIYLFNKKDAIKHLIMQRLVIKKHSGNRVLFQNLFYSKF